MLHHLARHRHFDAKKLVALAVLPFAGLEETGEIDGLRCVLTGEKPLVSKEFSLMVARTTDRILDAIGY